MQKKEEFEMYYIGIDLGGTNMKAALVNEACEIVAKKSIPTIAEHSADELVRDMANLSLDIVAEAGVAAADVKAVGIGIPGSVNSEAGVIIYTCNLPFRNTNIRKIFREVFDVPVFIGNDADCAALGEAFAGASKDCRHSMMITLGTGVGGGIIIDKKIYSGFNGIGGELGHMVIVYDGAPCGCGRKGCWEAYSSATGLIRMTGEAMDAHPESLMWKLCSRDNVSGKTAFQAEAQGDAAAAEVVDKYVSYLACGISNIINIFQPEVLCIGGGVSKEGDNLLKRLVPKVEKECYNRDVEKTRICIATLGNDAGLIGAAMLGR